MKLDTGIIDSYLDGSITPDIKEHWVFSLHGKTSFDMPLSEKKEEIRTIYEQVLVFLKDFQFRNKQLIDVIFPHVDITVREDICIYLIVGMPAPYDAMCFEDNNGHFRIIFDLIRIAEYCNNFEEVANMMSNLITHELTHVFIKENYKTQNYMKDFNSKLGYIVFDEGFAHYLSLSENTLEFDFNKYTNKQENAYYRLREAFKTNDKNEYEALLHEANTGAYWDKFGAIAGMFAISSYIGNSGNPYEKIAELYTKGPDFLINHIISEYTV